MSRETSARPLIFPGQHALSWLEDRLRSGLAAWAADWMARPPDDGGVSLVLEVHAAGPQAAPWLAGDFERVQLGAIEVLVRNVVEDRDRLAKVLFHACESASEVDADTWLSELLAEAWGCRNHHLGVSLLGRSDEAKDARSLAAPTSCELLDIGSGAVWVACEALGFLALIDRVVWSGLPQQTPPLGEALAPTTALGTCLSRSRVRLEAVLEGVTLDLADVLDFRRGDVLRLSQRLDAPVDLQCEGLTVARAALGLAGEHRAVQLLAASSELSTRDLS